MTGRKPHAEAKAEAERRFRHEPDGVITDADVQEQRRRATDRGAAPEKRTGSAERDAG